jgi:hypothetical protein
MISGNRRPPLEQPNLRRLISSLLTDLKTRLPSTWSVDLIERPASASGSMTRMEPDALLEIRAPDGTRATVVVEYKLGLEPRYLPSVAAQLRALLASTGAEGALVAAPFLSARNRELLTQAGLSYVDGTGNLRLALERPALFIETLGASADPWASIDGRPLRSLRGPTASRVVRALCDFRPPYGVLQLAKRSQTSLASVARVFAFLESEALIQREPRGPITDVRWADLIRRWTADYLFAKANRVQTYLEPRGLPALTDKLKAVSWRYAVTGLLAANRAAPIASPRLAAIYVDDADMAAMDLRLRPADAGANVLLAEPFDSVVYDRCQESDGVAYAAFSQVAADLLTSPGRGPAEAEELLRWMESHEDVWRV